MIKKLICYKCKNLIDHKENYIALLTYNDEKIIHEAHFHIKCWGLFNDEKVNERINMLRGKATEILKGLMPQAVGVVS